MTNPDTDTVFVTMYDPALGNVQVQAPLLAVPTYQSHGWLLLDPNATPPPVATPFLTQAAGDSRYLRAWLGGETLIAGAVRMTADGHIIVRNSNGTTRSTYDGTEAALWTVVGGGVAAVAGLTGSPTAQQIVTALDTPLKAALDARLAVASTVSASAALAVDTHTPVDATAAARTMTLPTGQPVGSRIIVEKIDATTNAVTVSGSIRGSAGTVTLVGQYETLSFVADSAGSWRPGPGHKTKAWLDSTYSPQIGLYKKWTDLPTGFVIPHRGAGSNIAPQDTLEAGRIGAGYGFGVIDGGDYRKLPDGTLANVHDLALPYTTLNGLGVNVPDLTASALQQLVVDAGRWFGGGWGNLKANTASQWFSEFGSYLLTPEAKEDTSVVTYPTLIQKILDYGLRDRVMFNSFSVTACAAATAAGIPNVCLNVNAPGTPVATYTAQMASSGCKYICFVGVPSDATIAAYIAAGYKVIAAGVRQFDKAHFDSIGVAGYYSDDPIYFASDPTRYRTSTAPWAKNGTYYHGHLSPTGTVDANRGVFVGSAGAYRWQPIDPFVLQGWACPLANAAGSYTLTVPITFDTVPGDTTRHLDVFICSPTDQPFNNQGVASDNGYNILCRANGTVQIYKILNGVTTGPVAAVTGTALASGQSATLVIAVTPTSITVTPTLNGTTLAAISTTDTANRGGYFFLGSGGYATGLRASFGAVTVS